MSESVTGTEVGSTITVDRQRSTGRRFFARLTEHSFVRYGVSGGASVALDTGLLALLHGVLNLWLPAATFLAVVAANVFNFTLNRLWSFSSQSPVGPQAVRYFTLVAGNWIFNVIGVSGLAALGVNYLVAKLAVLAVAGVLNYVGYRMWVFR